MKITKVSDEFIKFDNGSCEYYNGNNTLPIIDDVLTDYGKYSRIYKGCIKCNKINNLSKEKGGKIFENKNKR